ncbi:unnamed protein product [Linum trigynum]|uniref:Uncharacterized protein n=1 Tax=Linum trigynum TaxID=586398 RepID=A0AAV2ENT9_9ROSI
MLDHSADNSPEHRHRQWDLFKARERHRREFPKEHQGREDAPDLEDLELTPIQGVDRVINPWDGEPETIIRRDYAL